MTAAAVLAPPVAAQAAAPVAENMVLLNALRASLREEWKTVVLNGVGVILRDAFAAVGFGFKKCFNYAPLLHQRQVACLWHLELDDRLALAAAAAEVEGTDDAPREVPNMSVKVKIVVREVETIDPAGEPETRLLCSLAMIVPKFGQPEGATLGECWLERELLGITIHMGRRPPADIVAHVQTVLLHAVSADRRADLKVEAENLADYVLRGLAP